MKRRPRLSRPGTGTVTTGALSARATTCNTGADLPVRGRPWAPRSGATCPASHGELTADDVPLTSSGALAPATASHAAPPRSIVARPSPAPACPRAAESCRDRRERLVAAPDVRRVSAPPVPDRSGTPAAPPRPYRIGRAGAARRYTNRSPSAGPAAPRPGLNVPAAAVSSPRFARRAHEQAGGRPARCTHVACTVLPRRAPR